MAVASVVSTVDRKEALSPTAAANLRGFELVVSDVTSVSDYFSCHCYTATATTSTAAALLMPLLLLLLPFV